MAFAPISGSVAIALHHRNSEVMSPVIAPVPAVRLRDAAHLPAIASPAALAPCQLMCWRSDAPALRGPGESCSPLGGGSGRNGWKSRAQRARMLVLHRPPHPVLPSCRSAAEAPTQRAGHPIARAGAPPALRRLFASSWALLRDAQYKTGNAPPASIKPRRLHGRSDYSSPTRACRASSDPAHCAGAFCARHALLRTGQAPGII